MHLSHRRSCEHWQIVAVGETRYWSNSMLVFATVPSELPRFAQGPELRRVGPRCVLAGRLEQLDQVLRQMSRPPSLIHVCLLSIEGTWGLARSTAAEETQQSQWQSPGAGQTQQTLPLAQVLQACIRRVTVPPHRAATLLLHRRDLLLLLPPWVSKQVVPLAEVTRQSDARVTMTVPSPR